jgi:hypothetical protein
MKRRKKRDRVVESLLMQQYKYQGFLSSPKGVSEERVNWVDWYDNNSSPLSL